MKIIFSLLGLLPLVGYGQCPTGQSQVTIDVVTDSYGYEAYWQLVPIGNNCGTGTIFSGGNTAVGCSGGGSNNQTPGGYANNTTINEGPWCLVQGNTYDIIYVDDYGDGGITFNVNIDGFPIYEGLTGNGTSPNSTLSFTVTPPLAYDFEGEKINNYSYVNPGNIDVKSTFFNKSSNTINSLVYNYQIDSNPVVTQSISGQSIAPFTSVDFTHTTQWIASTNGTYTLKVWASNLNGNADMDVSNDLMTKIITVGPAIPNIIDSYIGITPQKTIIANSSNGILQPRDLDFHPTLTRNELWVVLKSTESSGGKTVKISNAGQVGQTSLVQQDGNAYHFMSLPTAIAFSENGNFATSPGVFDANHDGETPFTGPTLWSSDPLIYAQPSGGNGSHLDMLHESPYSMGIAYESDNVFWVNDGFNNTVVRYAFEGDHGPGNDDHSNGIIRRYSGLGLVEDPTQNVVSHLVYDKSTGWLYVADTGNDRIVRLNTTTGSNTGVLSSNEPTAEHSNYTGFSSSTYVNSGLTEPSGIDVIGNRMIVSDHTTGEIIIYDITGSNGVELGRIPTGTAGVMGVKIGPDGKIWYVNATTNQVIRLEPVNFVGVEEIEFSNISIYPNPTNSVVNIDFNSGATENNSLLIYNALGETIYKIERFDESKIQINTSTWSKGVYTVQVRSLNKNINQKLIIN